MNNETIARTILEQLGGRRFVVMTGARDLTAGDRAFVCHLPIGKARILSVSLNDFDTYDVSTFTRTGKMIETFINVYCDQLRATVEGMTGLALAL